MPLLQAAHFELVDDVIDLVEAGPMAWNDANRPAMIVAMELRFRRLLELADWQETGLRYAQNQAAQLAQAMCGSQSNVESTELVFRESSKEIWAACDWIIERSGGLRESIFGRLKTALLGVEYEWQAVDERALVAPGANDSSFWDRLSHLRSPERV